MIRILLVEDDPMMGRAVKVALSQAGHAVDLIETAEDAEAALDTTTYDLMVLDINLPGKSGLALITDLRKNRKVLPVLALTARNATQQKVEGLNMGIDDYLTKPFDLDELLARVQALFRRSKGLSTPQIENGSIALDLAAKTVWKDGEAVNLSSREFEVLAVLMGNIGKLFSKQEIEDKLYGWDTGVESNTVEVHISHLRKKLGEPLIKTVRGMGYVVEKIS
ncbi:MAG: response regulator transcription factor [Alphaproteobacteria bacterium]|nr:response regulator transcription factor [Alphaproteobacteria bacterium]